MGTKVSKPKRDTEKPTTSRPQPKPKDDKKRSLSVDSKSGKKPWITSTEKVRKQRILEIVPHKVFDAKSQSKSETNIKTVAKEQAALEDTTTPLYRPKLSKPKGVVAIPIEKLQTTFGLKSTSKSTDQVKGSGRNKGSGVFDLRKDQKQSGEKQGSPSSPFPDRKPTILSSPLLKNVMADRKAAEAKKAAAELARAQLAAKQAAEEEAARQHNKVLEKKDGGHKLQSAEKKVSSPPVAPRLGLGCFGHNPIRRGEDRIKAIQALIAGTEASKTTKFLKILRHKVHQGGDLTRLKQFGIPDQRQLLTVALSTDSWRYDFGGNLRHYYSPLLRSYIPNNMLERYRGVPPTSPCLSAIDLLSLGQKAPFKEQERQKRKATRDKHLDTLHEASLSETHYEFLKGLANNQPVTVPLTIMHDIAKEMAPMINHMQAFYNRNLGPAHECTEQATEAFVHVLSRVMVYNAL